MLTLWPVCQHCGARNMVDVEVVAPAEPYIWRCRYCGKVQTSPLSPGTVFISCEDLDDSRGEHGGGNRSD